MLVALRDELWACCEPGGCCPCRVLCVERAGWAAVRVCDVRGARLSIASVVRLRATIIKLGTHWDGVTRPIIHLK